MHGFPNKLSHQDRDDVYFISVKPMWNGWMDGWKDNIRDNWNATLVYPSTSQHVLPSKTFSGGKKERERDRILHSLPKDLQLT